MAGWVMAVEVTPSELVAVDIDRADRAAGGSLRPRRVPLDPGDLGSGPGADAVDVLADGFTRVLAGAEPGGPAHAADEDRPTRLVIATPPDTERRRFEEIAEATALVGLPAPAWLPAPVALVGDRIAAEVELGGQSVVLDARDGGLTTWPVRRTPSGAEIGSRGPIATGTRLDQLLLGVVRAQLHSLDPAAAAAPGDGPRPGSRPSGARDLRGEAARLRRSIRRARVQLAGDDVDEAHLTTDGHEIAVDRGVFDQLVEHALRETLAEVADGPEGPHGLVVHVLADHPTPLARRLVELAAGRERTPGALVQPAGPHDGVLGLAALLLPARSRPTRAATGAQAIRAARAVGSPSAPIGVPAGVGGPGFGTGGVGSGGEPGGQGPDGRGHDGRGHDGWGHDELGPDDGSLPTPATGWSLPDDAYDPGDPDDPRDASDPDDRGDPGDAGAAIPAARVPSSPVQAHRGTTRPAVPSGAVGREDPDDDVDHPAGGVDPDDLDADRASTGHLVLAGATPHEVRPASDAPPGGRPATAPSAARAAGRWAQGDADPDGRADAGPGPRATVRGRRGPDTAPQPVPQSDPRAGRAPRGVVPVLVVLVVLAVVAAVGVLLVGPDQVDAAFGGPGAGTGVLPAASWDVSW